jgi:hypothetical protein
MNKSVASAVFPTLLREANLAAELLSAGVTILRNASTTRKGLFDLALFDLSIGFEHVCKLIVVVDHYLKFDRTFPNNDALRRQYGHDLDKLFPAVVNVVRERKIDADYTASPSSDIHVAIISTLAQFALTTRYYNLDYLTGGKASRFQSGPAAWVDRVGQLILKKHYSAKKQLGDLIESQALQASMGDAVSAIRFDEAGKPITSLEQGLIHSAEIQVIQRFGQFYCLQLIRYLAAVLEELRSTAHRDGFGEIPFFGEIFAWFLNDDAMLKSRKTWRIPE